MGKIIGFAILITTLVVTGAKLNGAAKALNANRMAANAAIAQAAN